MNLEAEEIRNLFLQELDELLVMIEEGMLALEATPNDRRLIDQLFRGFHTIKGGAGMATWPALADYTHKVENLLDQVRHGILAVTSDLVSLLLDSLDCLKSFQAEALGQGTLEAHRIEESLRAILAFSHGQPAKPVAAPAPQPPPPPPPVTLPHPPPPPIATASMEEETIFHIQLRFNPTLFANHVDPMVLLHDLKKLGKAQIIPHIHTIPPLDQIDPGTLYWWWSVLLHTRATREEIDQVLMFFLEGHDVRVETLSAQPATPWNQEEIDTHVVKGEAPPLPRTAATVQPPLPVAIAPPPTMTPFLPDGDKTAAAPSQEAATIRVDITKFDKLMNLVGEIVILHARLNQHVGEVLALSEETGERLLFLLDDHDRTIQELRDHTMKLRMVPIGGIFLPLRRMVRDYAKKYGKQIELILEGQETEIDKTIIEQLSGPLKHLVRNAMDHGIESQETREANGKSPIGVITISAASKRGNVLVEISDDGAGINPEKVLASARRKGLVDADAKLTEQEIHHLLLMPGFSTAEAVTDISGRGVGLDVVRQEIEALRGKVEIESTPGQGSLFRIRLPLTLAIIEGMLVRVGKLVFTLPLLTIIESLQPHANQIKTWKGRGELVKVRKEYLPLLRLHQIFNLDNAQTEPAKGLIVVVEESGQRCCVLVDDIVDQQQVVIKSLEENFMPVEGIAGATLLGDGSISLILDVHGLIRSAHAMMHETHPPTHFLQRSHA